MASTLQKLVIPIFEYVLVWKPCNFDDKCSRWQSDVTRTLLRRPRRYAEGWSSENKRICVLMEHFLSGEGYDLTRAGVFDVQWGGRAR